MDNIVGLKELREHMERYTTAIEKRGESFVVVRRSKPLFKIVPLTNDEGMWEHVIDFTKIKKGGVSLKEVLKRL